MKKAITSISYLSLWIAHILTMLVHALVEVSRSGYVDDFAVLLGWSAAFVNLAWLIFIRPPLIRMDQRKWYFQPLPFPIITTFYALLVFTVLIGWLFWNDNPLNIWLVAAGMGFFFGLSYALLIRNGSVVSFYSSSLIERLSVLLVPIGFYFISLWLFPRVAPSTAYPYMPDGVQDRIQERLIPSIQVGQKAESLNQLLPGRFDLEPNASVSTSTMREGFTFDIQLECGIVTRIEWTIEDRSFSDELESGVECP